MKPIWIIGLDAGGCETLAPSLLRQIVQADILFGGKRHLSYFANSGQSFACGMPTIVPIHTNIDAVVMALKQAQQNEEQAVILASGDPLCYGIGATLRRYFSAEQLHIVPAPTAFQLAFAALGEPWSDAALLSAHARPVGQILSQILAAPKAAILTDDHHTPAFIAEALIQAGADPESPCAVCENLGGAEQNLIRGTLLAVQNQAFAKLNVFVVWVQQHQTLPQPPGLPDEAFSTSAGQITKREVRLLSLAELALQPDEVLWDIGAGSGAVGIEAGRSQPRARVYAIEKRLTLCQHIRENLSRFPTPNFHLTEGVAPNMITDWPDPHAVFIGGSGRSQRGRGHLADLIQLARKRLHPAGRLVINLATLENLHLVQTLLPEACINQVQINRGKPILASLRFEALNPVFIVTWQKKIRR